MSRAKEASLTLQLTTFPRQIRVRQRNLGRGYRRTVHMFHTPSDLVACNDRYLAAQISGEELDEEYIDLPLLKALPCHSHTIPQRRCNAEGIPSTCTVNPAGEQPAHGARRSSGLIRKREWIYQINP